MCYDYAVDTDVAVEVLAFLGEVQEIIYPQQVDDDLAGFLA